MPECARCHYQLADNASSCPLCGMSVMNMPADLHCAYCHSPLVDGAVFCPCCGTQVEGAVECEDYVYEAFVSYRHLPHDAEVAMQIQRRVEGFKIPKDLRGQRNSAKLGRLFRDEDELPTSSSLSDQIRDALKRSRFLLVVCTPQTRESRWVAQEVELFSSFHGRDRVLVALAEAEPSDSFPELLLHRKTVDPDGTVHPEATEPLAADFRDKAKYKQEAMRIAATLIGCGYDDLRHRQRARRNAQMAKIGAAVTAVSLAFSGFSAYQQAQITASQHQLQISQSRFLAQEVDDLLAQGNRMQAIQAALVALPESSTSNDRPFVPEAQNALERALQTYRTTDGWYPRYSHTEQANVQTLCVNSEEGLYAVLDQTNTVHVYRTATGEQTAAVRLDENASDIMGSDDEETDYFTWKIEFCGQNLLAYKRMGTAALCFDASDGALMWSYVVSSSDISNYDEQLPSIAGIASTDDGSKVALILSSYIFDADYKTHYINGATILDGQTGEPMSRSSFETDEDGYTTNAQAVFDDTGNYVAVHYNTHLALFNLNDDSCLLDDVPYQGCEDIIWSGSTLLVVSSDWVEDMEDDESGTSWPCVIQAFDTKLEQIWSIDTKLDMISRGLAIYETDFNFWSDDLDGDGSHARVLASVGCDLMAIDTATGTMEVLNTFADPICCAKTSGEGDDRGIHVCTAQGTLTYSSLHDPSWGESNTDRLIEEVSYGRFSAPVGGNDDDWGFLVSIPADLTAQRTTTVRTLCSCTPAREAFGLRHLSIWTFNSDRTLFAGVCASSSYSSAPQEPALYVFDASSFDTLMVLDGSQMTQAGIDTVWTVSFLLDDPNTLVVFGDTAEGESAICTFNAHTGDLLTSRIVEDDSTVYNWTPCAGNGQIVTFVSGYPNNAISMLDPATLEEVSRIENEAVGWGHMRGRSLDANCATSGIWSNGDVIALGPDDEGLAIMLDTQTGEQLESEFSAYSFEGESVLFHGRGNEGFCIGAGPSELACFDLPEGSLRWSCEVPQGTPEYFAISPDGSIAVMQASGSLIALDTATGSVLGTSTNPVGTVHGCSFSADSNMIYAQCQMPDDSFSRCTLHAIRLDDPTLTPISSIDFGVTLSSDEGEVIIDNSSSSSSTWVLPYLSLDELIAQGSEVTAGFELTDQQRHALMIE